jgi:uncharacterized C2H2 Zn-finger protein
MQKCPRCSYETKLKANLVRHLQNKKVCEALHCSEERDAIIARVLEKENVVKSCGLCSKHFKTRGGYQYHMKNAHGITKEYERIRERVQQIENETIKKELDALKKENEDIRALFRELNKPSSSLEIDNHKLLKDNQILRNKLLQYQTKRREEFYQVIVENYLGGTHARLNVGVTDVTTPDTHAEVKEWEKWKYALGQLKVYATDSPREHLHMYLFGKYKTSSKQTALDIIKTHNIRCFEFEEQGGTVTITDVETGEEMYRYFIDFDNESLL